MKRLIPLAFAAVLVACAASLFTGCCSVSVSNQGKDMVLVQNDGCFLFFCIPLFSGDPNYPNEEVCNWFENTVHTSTNVKLLEEEAARQGARGLRNIVTMYDEETIITLLLKRKIYRTSAELIKD